MLGLFGKKDTKEKLLWDGLTKKHLLYYSMYYIMNLKKIAFAECLNEEQKVVAFILILVPFLTAILGMFSENNSEIMIFSALMTSAFLLADAVLLVAFLMDFFKLNKELNGEVELLRKYGCNQEQIEIILNNRKDFWFLLEHLRGKEERIKIKENDERVKNLYKSAGIDFSSMNLLN